MQTMAKLKLPSEVSIRLLPGADYCIIHTVPKRVRQVLNNYLSNASSIRKKVSSTLVITCRKKTGFASLSVIPVAAFLLKSKRMYSNALSS